METGKVTKIVKERGFGFIRADGSGKDFFFHRTGMLTPTLFEQLVNGQRVEFLPNASEKGWRAEDVTVV